jgi:CheY-like chemotaxis protein
MPVGGSVAIVAANAVVGPQGGPRGVRPGAYVRISVTDTGLGMDEATLAKAMEPFFTTKGPGKGTGLGLSMVHGLAAQSGGTLHIASEPGRGTTVDLWLPQADADAPLARSAMLGEAPPPEEASPQVLPRAILVVDDDVLVSTGTAAMLEDLGHTVVEAQSGVEALHVLGSEMRIDLVITDHAMPGMTGLELARRIEAEYPGLPVILATGYAELTEEDAARLPRLGKPFRQEELLAAIADVVAPAPLADNVITLRGR